MKVWSHNCMARNHEEYSTYLDACPLCGEKPKESNVPQVKITDEMVEAALGKAKERQVEPALRDQFAMSALQGILASQQTDGFLFSHIADMSYRAADAMLQERNK